MDRSRDTGTKGWHINLYLSFTTTSSKCKENLKNVRFCLYIEQGVIHSRHKLICHPVGSLPLGL